MWMDSGNWLKILLLNLTGDMETNFIHSEPTLKLYGFHSKFFSKYKKILTKKLTSPKIFLYS